MVEEKKQNDTIDITLNKKTLQSLTLNLNKNIIMNIVAYNTVLNKLIETEENGINKSKLQHSQSKLKELENITNNLFDNIQLTYGIEEPEKSEQIINGSKTSGLITGLLTGEMAVMASAFAAAAVLLGGNKKTKKTKRRNVKKNKNKKTKRRK
jgi:hypothetical protein